IDERFAIPELRRVFNVNGHPHNGFDHELAYQSGMVRRATGHHDDPINRNKIQPVEFLSQSNLAVMTYPACESVTDSARLLVDFLQHEVWVAFALGHLRSPRHRLRFAPDRDAV